MKHCALTHRHILCSLDISLPLLEATFPGLDSIVAERLEVHFKQPNRHVDFRSPTKSTTEADHAKQMCMVICQADSGKGLEQAASSRGVQGDAALLCCLPPGARSRTGDWQFSPTALRIPLSTVRRPERTAIALCFFCLLSNVPAASCIGGPPGGGN